MLQIDYFSLLKDLGIKDSLISNFKKDSNLTDQQIEKIYHDKVEYHGQKMNDFIQNYLTQYLNLKADGETDIDAKLDSMVSEYLNNKQVK